MNISFFAISLFLIIGIFESNFQGSYSPLIYEFSEKQDKSFLNVKHIYVNAETPIYKIIGELNKHKFNVLYVKLDNGKIISITEVELQKLLTFCSPTSKIKNLIK